VAPHDELHQVVPEGETPQVGVVIPPTYVSIPGIGQVPQYAPTVAGPFIGYNPAQDCNGYYMSYRFQPNNNCYAYSCDIASNSFAQPGRMHGYQYPDPPTGPGVQTGAEKDGLVYVGSAMEDIATHAELGATGHYVALLISSADSQYGWPGDYHWVRCDDVISYQSWSQKDGNDQVTNFDFAGSPITNPADANWTVNQGPVSTDNPDDLIVAYDFFAYMFVPWGDVSII
jgi:hypothetical protein